MTFPEFFVKPSNFALAAYLLLSLAAIPLLDETSAVSFRELQQPVCQLLQDDWGHRIRIFATILCAALVIVTNYELFSYLIVISGRHDQAHPHDRQIAVVVSCALFFCLILLYAALYFIHLPCLHFHVLAQTWPDRMLNEVVTDFYFSTETITTLGYGDFNAKGHLTGEVITSLEAINGLIAFGVFTGAIAGLMASRDR